MLLDEVFDFKEDLTGKGIIFCYVGVITQSLMEEIGDVLKKKLELEFENFVKIQTVFSIFVEQVQNLINYAQDEKAAGSTENNMKYGIIIIGKTNEKFYTIGGNAIENIKTDILTSYIEKIKKMNKEELKILYKEKLRNSDLNPGGAGLGIIEMARKSSEPLEYCIKKLDDKISFFSIKVII
jgi:hypothetical protein